MIRITSKKAGFRRCGIAHPAGPVEYPSDKFSKEQIAVLRAEPMLIVETLPDPPEPKAGKGGGKDEENDENAGGKKSAAKGGK